MARRSKQWPEVWILHIGMLLLSILSTSWSVLHISDVIVHFRRARVPYGYILVGCLYKAFRVISDVFVVWGTGRVLIRYRHLRPNIWKPQSVFCLTAIVAVLLLFIGVYQICLMFALSFAWLSFSDLNVINAIAKARSGFEIAFTALAFVITLGIAALTMLRDLDSLYQEELWSVPASIALLIRSFCEIVIVGQLDRSPAGIQNINRARDITYGLFSVLFVGCITFAIPAKGAEDPLAKREEIARE
ncbi:hypothetical protein MMC31_001194 [Peltigera leucophlebia]|nr:hypothetical protein [Peltigera leucophlebia]